MKNWSTIVLRLFIVAIGCIILAICAFVLPAALVSEVANDFDYGPIMIGMYITALPFFYALFQALALVRCIETGKVFSKASVLLLRRIKYCAFIISGLYAAGMPYIFYLADRDDAPGVAALGFVIVGASFVIATASAVFERLVQTAMDIKSENDLTV